MEQVGQKLRWKVTSGIFLSRKFTWDTLVEFLLQKFFGIPKFPNFSEVKNAFSMGFRAIQRMWYADVEKRSPSSREVLIAIIYQ